MNNFSGPKVEQHGNHLYGIIDGESNSREYTNYNIYRGTSSGTYELIASVDGSTFSYTDTDVSNNVTYYYVATSVWDGDLESGYSNEASATPEPFVAPAPENLVATAGDAQVGLEWDAVESGDGGGTGGGTDGGGAAFPECPDGSAEYVDCADTCFNDADCTGGCLNWLADGYCDDGTYGLSLIHI